MRLLSPVCDRGERERGEEMGILFFFEGNGIFIFKKSNRFYLSIIVSHTLEFHIQIYSKLLGDGWIFVYICDVCDIFVVSVEF